MDVKEEMLFHLSELEKIARKRVKLNAEKAAILNKYRDEFQKCDTQEKATLQRIDVLREPPVMPLFAPGKEGNHE